MRIRKVTLLFCLLLVLTLLEVLCNTHFFNADFSINDSNWLNAIYLLCGLAIPAILLIKVPQGDIVISKLNVPVTAFVGLGTGIFIVAMFIIGYGLFNKNPLDYHYADMLPKIKVMNERWLHHQDVYAPITEIWNGLLPNYLPAMWLPFLPAVIFHFDLRMIALAGVLIGLALTIFSIAPRLWNWYSVIALIPFILLVNYNIYRGYFVFTEEGLIVGFYIFLAFSIIKNDVWLLGISICLCLLSRFSFLGWLPLFFLITYIFFPRKAVKVGIIALVLGLFLMVSSQAIYHLRFFANLSKFYSGNLYDPFVVSVNTTLISKSLGLARFVPYDFLRYFQTALTIITVAFPILGWVFYRRMKNATPQTFLLAMLKLNLVLFYSLMTMPFMYLFFTSTFLSCFILFWYSGNMKQMIKPVTSSIAPGSVENTDKYF